MKPRTLPVVVVCGVIAAAAFVVLRSKNPSGPMPKALSKMEIEPKIATVWTAAVAAGLDEAKLSLNPDGSFTMESKTKGKAESLIRGTFTVEPPPPNMPTEKMAKAKVVKFFYDLDSLKAAGMSAGEIAALEKSGKKSSLGMQLWYFSEVPVLTDVMTAHFVPENDKEAATQRLSQWKPF